MLSHQHPIGRVKDADNTPYNYCFIAPISSSQLTTGEFVTCEIELGNERELIYGRIKNRRTINPYPDTFFLDPLIDPDTIAQTSNYPHENYPLLKITVTIIGYFDNELKEFINPRIGPISGTHVYLAISKELERLFNKTIEHHYDQVWIGKFPNRPTYVSLDAVTLARTHVAILSGMGARETHFVMGIISSTFNYNAHAATLLIDTRNKYGMTVKALDLLSNHPAHQYPHINTYTHRDVKIDLASLSLEEIKLLLPDLQKEEAQLLQEAFYSVQQDSKTAHGNPFQWTLSQLLKRIGDLHQLKFDNHTNIKEQDYMVGNLRSYLSNIAKEAFISEDEDDVPPRELYLPDQCSLLRLNNMSAKIQKVLVSSILRRLLWRRTQTVQKLWRRSRATQEEFEAPHPLHLPYPVVVILAEAHRFAPEKEKAVSSDIIKEILDKGHEFGVGMMILSQQPSKLDGDVISQCNTYCLLQMSNERDQQWVSENVKTVEQSLLDELPALGKGHAILAGEAVRTPVVFKMYTPDIPFGETSKNDTAEWNRYFEKKKKS